MSKYSNKVKERKKPRKNERFAVDPSIFDSEWIKCPRCFEDLKSKNLEPHLDKVHHLQMVKKGEDKNNIVPLVVLLTMIIIVIAGGIYYLTGNDSENNEGDGHETPPEGWLDNYSPDERVGSSEEDWWTVYPTQNPSWGEMPDHPSWLTDKLKNGPILILDHSEGCEPCVQQQADVDSIMKNYGEDIQFVKLLSGTDARAAEVFQIYDPNGSPSYVPLTIIVTLVEDSSGNVRIGWHGDEGATGIEWLTDYVKDAIYYHHNNVDDWS